MEHRPGWPFIVFPLWLTAEFWLLAGSAAVVAWQYAVDPRTRFRRARAVWCLSA